MITIVVHDKPEPQGSHVAVVSKSTGKAFVKRANEKNEKTWRSAVRDAVVKAMDGRPPLEGPVALAVTLTLPKPVSAPKRKPVWPWKKPDCDKLLRSVFDGLTAGGAYRDDAQVIEVLRLAKYYPERDAPPISLTEEVMVMPYLAGTRMDVLSSPGVVVRLAHLTEFPGVRGELEKAGYEPKDVPGGG